MSQTEIPAAGISLPGCVLAREGAEPGCGDPLLHSSPPQEVFMSYRCEICGKEPWVGKQVSFSHKSSSRRWLPNIQRVRVKHGSNSRRARVCTSCIKAGKVEKV